MDFFFLILFLRVSKKTKKQTLTLSFHVIYIMSPVNMDGNDCLVRAFKSDCENGTEPSLHNSGEANQWQALLDAILDFSCGYRCKMCPLRLEFLTAKPAVRLKNWIRKHKPVAGAKVQIENVNFFGFSREFPLQVLTSESLPHFKTV